DQISMFRVVPRLLLWKTIVPFTPGNAPADEGRPATAASASGSRRASLELMSLPPAARIGPEAELGGELDVVVVIGGPPVEAAAVDGARLAVADGRVAAGDREPRVADGPAATQEAAGPLQDVLLRPPDGEPAVHRVGGLPEPVAPVPDEAVERAAHRLVRRRAPAPPGVVRPPRPAEGRADDRVVAVVGGPGTRAPRERRARDDDGQAFHPSPLLAGAQANATTAVGDATVGIPPHFARARGDRRTGCGARRVDELRRRAAARPAGARPPRRGRRRQDDALRRGRPAGRRARRPHARRPAGRERRPVLLLRPRRPPREPARRRARQSAGASAARAPRRPPARRGARAAAGAARGRGRREERAARARAGGRGARRDRRRAVARRADRGGGRLRAAQGRARADRGALRRAERSAPRPAPARPRPLPAPDRARGGRRAQPGCAARALAEPARDAVPAPGPDPDRLRVGRQPVHRPRARPGAEAARRPPRR